MKVYAYLLVTIMTLHATGATLSLLTSRRPLRNKNKGPFGGYLANFGTAALDGFLRYAPDFYDAVPKVAHKLLGGGKKTRYDYYDEDEEYPLLAAGKRTMKRLFGNKLAPAPHVVHVPVYHGGFDGFGYGGHGGFAGYGGFGGHQYPLSISHGSFDELPVHGVFHDSLDFGKFPAVDLTEGWHGGLYGHDYL